MVIGERLINNLITEIYISIDIIYILNVFGLDSIEAISDLNELLLIIKVFSIKALMSISLLLQLKIREIWSAE